MQEEDVIVDLTGSTTTEGEADSEEASDSDSDSFIVIPPLCTSLHSTHGPDIPLQKAVDARASFELGDLEGKGAGDAPQQAIKR